MYFLGVQESEFFMFSQGCTRSWEVLPDTFQSFLGSCYNIKFKPYATFKMKLFVTKIDNSWKTVIACCYRKLFLKLPVVTKSFVLIVTGLLDLTLKHIGKFRLRQQSTPSGIYKFKFNNNNKKHQKHVKYIQS